MEVLCNCGCCCDSRLPGGGENYELLVVTFPSSITGAETRGEPTLILNKKEAIDPASISASSSQKVDQSKLKLKSDPLTK